MSAVLPIATLCGKLFVIFVAVNIGISIIMYNQ